MSLEAWGDSDEEMRAPDGYVTEEQAEEMVLEAFEKAASQCDHEANVQATYATEARTPGLRLIHSTASNTLMSVAYRIRALKGA